MAVSQKGWLLAVERTVAVTAYLAAGSLPLAAIVLSGPAQQGEAMVLLIGTGSALLACSLLAIQPVLAARSRMLDRLFGLDIVYIFHKTMGMIAGVLLVCALVFLGAAGAWAKHWAGLGASALIIILAATAFLYRQLGMTYESWRVLHNTLALSAIVASFAEALQLTEGNAAARTLAIILFIAAGAAYAQHRIVGPARRRRRTYRVQSVTQETSAVWTLTFEPPEGAAAFDYLPGQFQFLTFESGRGEEHPFTISSSPTKPGGHSATIKESGDFTRTIGQVRPGDRVAVQGPFGRFSYVLHSDEKDLVLIAGGIGITPFMSMIRHMRDTGADKDVLLLYANNTEEDIVFRRELDAIAAGSAPRLRVVHVLSKAGGGWQGERGFISKALMKKYCAGGIPEKAFYVCGPPPMMAVVITQLIELGAVPGRVRSERFAL